MKKEKQETLDEILNSYKTEEEKLLKKKTDENREITREKGNEHDR